MGKAGLRDKIAGIQERLNFVKLERNRMRRELSDQIRALKSELSAVKKRADRADKALVDFERVTGGFPKVQALVDDAQRWRAIMACGRVRVLGWAGLSGSTISKESEPYAHIGLEIWTIHPNGEHNAAACERVREFADKARRVLLKGDKK